MTNSRFSRVLIANRGEIAVRIIRALRDIGMESVAIYSDADRHSLHVRLADFAVRLPGNTSAETYLNIPLILQAIKSSKAQALHPGFGFLSENPDFAQQVIDLGCVFIGPPPSAMHLVGDKIHAKNLMIKNGVPVVPGSDHPLKDVEELKSYAKKIGYPLILKAAAGGGGRGMRVVRKDSELADAFDACSREAVAYFGSKDVFCERFIEFPRHIEFQVLFDQHGNGVHLFERDCSIQRRHQKLIEEAPSAYLNDAQRQRLGDIALKAAAAAGYQSAGTVEFICESPDHAYFMEMNTRIQVEHPVTELITGTDLIALQIQVALGEKLPFTQKDMVINGWCFEARINAEDPAQGFAPGPGRIESLHFPGGPGVRIDSHLYVGYEIPSFYDSMIAKLIVWGPTRVIAMERLRRALAEMRIEGVPTTIKFHEALLRHDDFRQAKFTTRFIEQQTDYFAKEWHSEKSTNKLDDSEYASLLAAILFTRHNRGTNPYPNNPSNKADSETPTTASTPWQLQSRREGIRRD